MRVLFLKAIKRLIHDGTGHQEIAIESAVGGWFLTTFHAGNGVSKFEIFRPNIVVLIKQLHIVVVALQRVVV